MISRRALPIVLLFIWISCASATISIPHLPEITLTLAERQWLEKQEELRFSMVDNQNPVAFQVRNGDMDGIIPEYMKLLEEIIGKKIRIIPVSDDPVTVSNLAKEMRLHGILAVFKNKVTQNLFIFSEPYFKTPLYVFATKNNRRFIQNFADLTAKKIAVLQGHQMMNTYADAIKGVEKIIVESPKKQMELLQYGEVDAILGYMTYHHLIREFMFDNIIPAYSSDNAHSVYLGVLPEHPLLQSIFDKAILSLPKSTIQKIVEKWLKYSTMDEADGLSAREQNWIKEKHTVRARVSYWPPYMFLSPEPSGMAVDYLKFVAERYGINVEFIPAALGWKASLKDLKKDRKHYDLILTMNPTLERKKMFALSEPYLKIPWVIFTQKNSRFISSIDDLNDKIIAIESGFAMQKKLQTLYPKIHLNEVQNSLAALEAVSTGDSDAYIGNLANATFLIREHGLSNVKVAAPTPFESHTQAMAVRPDWPELASIVTQGLNFMTQKDHDEIKNRWLAVRYEHGINFWDVFLWSLLIICIAATIILLFARINKKLNGEITKRKKTETRLEEYIGVLDENVMTITTGNDRVISKVSNAFCKSSKYSQSELMGNTHEFIHSPEKENEFYEKIWQTIDNGDTWNGEIQYRTKEGETFWVNANMSPITDHNQRPIGCNCIYQDITDKKNIEVLAITDSLTGLYNRLKLEALLSQEVLRSARYNCPLSVAIIDIDHFKSVNDTFGHQTGDLVLRLFSQILKKNIRTSDVVGRWGGEEFLIICPHSDLDGGVKMVEKLRKIIEDSTFKNVGRKTASFGITSFQPNDTPEKIVHRADEALYRAKSHGRNCVVHV